MSTLESADDMDGESLLKLSVASPELTMEQLTEISMVDAIIKAMEYIQIQPQETKQDYPRNAIIQASNDSFFNGMNLL